MNQYKIIRKLEDDNKAYANELARVKKEYEKLVKKYKRLNSDFKKLKFENDRLSNNSRQSSNEARFERGVRGWPVKRSS